MAGAIGISDEVTWYTNGWGWRQLLEQAVRIAPAGYGEHLDRYKVQPGLTFSQQVERDRLPIAETLLRAAESLIVKYGQSDDDYERRYAQRLRELVVMLNDEIPKLNSAG